MAEALLEIHDLNTSFFTHLGEVKAVSDVSFDVRSGEVVAVVGESGSGKSVTALSIMNLISSPVGLCPVRSALMAMSLCTSRSRKCSGSEANPLG